ncbi:cyclic nucleotide-binding domain-containing protein [Corticibacter populi]|uniref:Cyclic nucleotide-binding domain-containing protein n=1 Tax=Corticibacter populi TaxID=1550736 RepID=A0A3M6QU51_9BURK|nr:cyclic nucleotide-binding domain-containing protein [Corticibacter populi]RMX06002.1 cyclic nucleotide-binding domain-containing protein [Corticibacter populi]RZS30665.1 cyclic nucleotide-binding protein [Corticibacter populi]
MRWPWRPRQLPHRPVPAEPASAPADGLAPGFSESALFSSVLNMHGAEPGVVIPWQARSAELGARRLGRDKGIGLLQAAWARQGPSQPFERQQLATLGLFMEFVTVAPNRELIQQGEYGDFMLVLLGGVMAVERSGPTGEPLRMAEAGEGDLLGEMSLLDHGMRFSSCLSLTECELAVLTSEGLDEMMHNEPHLAARLMLMLARKLSVRLRVVSAKLNA